jgi:hypothetical protein
MCPEETTEVVAPETSEVVSEVAPAAVEAAPQEQAPAEKSMKEKLDEIVATKNKPIAEPAATADAFTPNFKIKVGEKEMEIPKQFQALMKDKETEKEVRDIFERSYGIDITKDKLSQERAEKVKLSNENTAIKSSIDGLRSIYQQAVSTGNFHKMDGFFERLQIPQEVILRYAAEKAKLMQMPDDQRQVIESQLQAERRSEEALTSQQTMGQRLVEQERQVKVMLLDSGLQRPDVKACADVFDGQVGRPGAFREEVARLGQYEWVMSQGKVNLSPDQAIQKAIEYHGLKGKSVPQAAPTQAAAAADPNPGKRVIQRTDQIIPNIQGKSGSPLKQKPRSLDDLKRLSAEANKT